VLLLFNNGYIYLYYYAVAANLERNGISNVKYVYMSVMTNAVKHIIGVCFVLLKFI